MPSPSNLILLGVITGCHGVKGHVKIKSFTAYDEDIFAYGDLQLKNGAPAPTIKPTGSAKNQIIALIEGVNSRNEAEALKGTEFYIERDQLPPPDDGEFYIEDLKGLDIHDLNSTKIGVIEQVANYGAGDIVDIRFTDGRRESFSFTETTFPEIDIEAGFLKFQAPDILVARKEAESE